MRYIKDFIKYRFLLSELVKKGIKLKYRRSYLGIIWSLLEPLLTMIVLTIVFGTLFGNHTKEFPVYILTGRLLYTFFSTATKTSLSSIRKNSAMIKKVYVPMTETAFFILLCLRKPNHGYGVVQMVEKMTDGAIRLTPGTMYGSLSKMEKDNIIRFIREEDKRKIYQITDLGLEVLQLERKRIERLYKIAQEEM